ncbi:hypothetical protein F750_0702 [Streptomyces sp. PAMC 26508]|nr:hypothetical protein F750_0702 [Streptomyces sp. PAMC 26508]
MVPASVRAHASFVQAGTAVRPAPSRHGLRPFMPVSPRVSALVAR